MSGHSKWAKIKRDKASNDAKRGAIFTKLGNQIAVAARQGLDPNTNSALSMAIETAKSFNMPQSTIDRAIKRIEDKSALALEEILYEGYAPGGVAVLVECTTDNRKRTYPEVRSTFSKGGGNIGETGSVTFNFKRCGAIVTTSLDDEKLFQALETGVEDTIDHQDGLISLITSPTNLHQVLGKLKALDLKIEHAGLTYIAKNTMEVDDRTLKKVHKLVEALDDLNDTINVYTNLA